jgi:hypothetical protein
MPVGPPRGAHTGSQVSTGASPEYLETMARAACHEDVADEAHSLGDGLEPVGSERRFAMKIKSKLKAGGDEWGGG